jgi:hypothetical protein
MAEPSAPDLSEIKGILQRHHETGVYGGCHFRLTPTAWAVIRQATPPQPPLQPWMGASLHELLSIPIVIDDDLPDGEWRLVRPSTDEVLLSGRVNAP